MDNENTENENSKTNNEAEGNETDSENVSIPKKDYDNLNQTLGSLKREIKDLKKAKEEPKETAQTNQPDNSLLEKLERMALRQAGITHTDDVELAQKTAKKWGVDIDEVLNDEDFKVKLERQQSSRTNIEATSNVRGGTGTSGAKNTPEYWLAKGVPPSATDIPDGKARRKINAAFYKASKQDNIKFYNS
jgi:hypothetical protein